MSTNAMIFKMDNNKVRGIYCHWDGYPDYVGAILRDSYQNPNKVDNLINLGEISSLGDNVSAHPFVKKYGFEYLMSEEYEKLNEYEKQTLIGELKEYTLAYHRDRGEDLKIMEMTVEEFSNKLKNNNFPYSVPVYLYLMKANKLKQYEWVYSELEFFDDLDYQLLGNEFCSRGSYWSSFKPLR